ncbi:WG repeat-containing protein [Nostoc sp. CMAA1605]|uniref:WG repeat-containing protein n=1 Tax=Nostoc sp. CMAA1605 TaxID=2055159 RepID=UPI001F2D083D|nr:WG repeat-containing protein [Nostoc sp. CMAA1605]MCF4967085.1 serine/threonine protein kinase [Nostoc sp. CMAA1605]
MIGRILRKRYKIIGQLGYGGFGETYLAEDLDIPTETKPKCVIKHLKPRAIAKNIPYADIERLFKKEAEILYKLGQTYTQIPKLYAYFEQRKNMYIVQEFIDGNDLSQEITSGTRWKESDVIRFLEEMLKILVFIHEHNVIHRDIKPSNIMRRKFDGKLVLIDFGLVKPITTSGILKCTIPVGSPGYVPVEQFQGRPKFSSDIYALGITAIQALTGIDYPMQLSIDATDEIAWRDLAQVSESLAQILDKMVLYDFRKRYSKAAEVLNDLNFNILRLQPSNYEWLSPVRIGRKWGYMDDRTGQVIIQPQFEDAYEFTEGLASVRIGEKYGYIDTNGNFIIHPQFEWAYYFSEGLAEVLINGKSGYINVTGKVVIQPQFDMANLFSSGLAEVCIGDQYYLIDKTGKFIEE